MVKVFEEPIKEVMEGYWAGRSSASLDYPEICRHKSSAFKHGWLNGRDDRVGYPREKSSVLRARGEIILNNTGGIIR